LLCVYFFDKFNARSLVVSLSLSVPFPFRFLDPRAFRRTEAALLLLLLLSSPVARLGSTHHCKSWVRAPQPELLVELGACLLGGLFLNSIFCALSRVL
jgi:hypothetical protein